MKRAFLALLLFAVPLFAEDTIGWHVVKEGETLSGITAKYLGSSAAWRENWRLNPGIRNPNALKPGQRVQVILSRTLPARSAVVNRVARKVEKKPEPSPWTTARAGDRLVERNGIRTYEASSAELRFEDDSVLTLTERSLVFLRGTKSVAPNRDASAIEIIDGHADLDKTAKAPRAHDIEIVVGTTVAKTAPGEAKARFRKEGVNAQVMSYRGTANVASAGAAVKVAAGMGVAVPEGKKPPKPERLLVAPATQPRDVAEARPMLRWSAVERAASYTAEVCRDAGCAEIVAREAMLTTTEWQPPALEAGEYVFRVSARSASGLDGFASVAPLTIRRAVVVVTSLANSGPGSLRAAFELANASKTPYEIEVREAGTIALTEPLPRLTTATTLRGIATEVPIGSVTTVGVPQMPLANPARSQLTIDFGGAAVGIDAESPLTIRDLTLVGAGTTVRAASSLTMENVVVGTLLARTESTGIEAHGPTRLHRVLVTGMLQAGILARSPAILEADSIEVSNSGDGIVAEAAGSRIRDSLFLLNQTGAALATGSAIERSTFRGNRTARVLASRAASDSENVFEDNVLTAVVAGRVTRISMNDDGHAIVSGSAIPGAAVEIFTNTSVPARVTADASGTFEVQLEKVVEKEQ